MTDEVRYLVMPLREVRRLRDAMVDDPTRRPLPRTDPVAEVSRMIALADWYGWGPEVPIQWSLDRFIGCWLLNYVSVRGYYFENRVYKTPEVW